MANILLQTTIPFTADDWNVSRFSMLAQLLESSGHTVTTRNRDALGSDDAILSKLPDSGFDQVWLMAVDMGDGLTENDARAILEFRRRGGGVFTARDHQDLGGCLASLGSIATVNYFHTRNVDPDSTRLVSDDQDNPNISFPNYHSGANGDYQYITPLVPVHELLRSERAPGGVIEFFPAHPHEGAVGVPTGASFARVIATGTSKVSGRQFNLAVVIEDETNADGSRQGRVIAESTFHHVADFNWDVDLGAPSFVTDKPGTEIKRDPERLETFKDYVRNAARWLGARSLAKVG